MFAFDVGVYCRSLVVELCEQLYAWLLDSLFPQSLPHAAALNCVKRLFEVNGCNPKWLVPHSGSLSELLER